MASTKELAMRRAIWLILPLALLAAPAAAQDDQDNQDDQVVCVGGPHWRASLPESRSIESEPVPASYRLLFESTEPCIRWALDEESIVAWHMGSGSPRSIAPALAYLERDYLRDEPAPEAYRGVLERAWRSAQPDLRRAQAIQQPQGLDYSLRSRFTAASRPIRRLEALIETREKISSSPNNICAPPRNSARWPFSTKPRSICGPPRRAGSSWR
jgi:hypothetical protein